MSKPVFWSLLALCAVSLLVCLWWFVRPQEVQPTEDTGIYLLKDCGGKLALYDADDPEAPLRTYDIYTYLLPEGDVLALQQGVPVRDDVELERLLEDYGL